MQDIGSVWQDFVVWGGYRGGFCQKGQVGEGGFMIWFYFSLYYSDLICKKLFFPQVESILVILVIVG